MMYKRRKAKYMRMDHERNKDTLNKLKTVFVLNKISKYNTHWIQHVDRMQRKDLGNY
jgi:hypothetical protein